MGKVTIKKSQFTKAEDGTLTITGKIAPTNKGGKTVGVTKPLFFTAGDDDAKVATMSAVQADVLAFLVTYKGAGVVVLGASATSLGGAGLNDSIELTLVDDTDTGGGGGGDDTEATALNMSLDGFELV